MANKRLYFVFLAAAAALLCGCSVSKKALLNYYKQHEETLDSVEASYKHLYAQKPFSIGFSDRSFNYVSVTIITDSLQYIYEFGMDEPRLKDTLAKYKLDITGVTTLIRQMHTLHCTWINSLDYYVNERQMYMVFL